MTPATDSAQNSLTPPATSPRLIDPVFVEDRIGGEVAELAAVEAVVDVGVGPELGDHDFELGRVEIPSERAGDQAAEQKAQRIEAPALQLQPLALRDASRRRKPNRRRHSRARRSRPSPESARRRHRPRDRRGTRARGRDRRQRPRARPSRIAIGAPEPAEERRRSVGAADDRRGRAERGARRRAGRRRARRRSRIASAPGARRMRAAMRMKPMNSAP